MLCGLLITAPVRAADTDAAPIFVSPGLLNQRLPDTLGLAEAPGTETITVFRPAARRLWEGPAMVETHGLYALNARLAAEQASAFFIDLSNLSIGYFESLGREQTKDDFLWLSRENANERFPDGVEDNTHFKALGACGVARVIAVALSEIPGTSDLVDAVRIGPDAEAGVQARPPAVLDCESRTVWKPDRD